MHRTRADREAPIRVTRRALAVLAALVVVAACRSSSPTTSTTTTTVPVLGPTRPSTTLTTTTLGATNDPSFHTRRAGALTVATDHLTAPYFDLDPATGAAVDGFEFDLARVLASRLGLGRVIVVRGSLVSIQRGFDCGCDLFLGGVAVTDALARRVDLSVPYVAADPVALVRAGVPAPTVVTARTLRWAIAATDDQAVRVINESIKPDTSIRTVPTTDDVVRIIATGEVDAGILPAPVALLAAKADPTLAVAGRFGLQTGWAVVEGLGSANSPSLNDLIERLASDGTLAFINRLHLGVEPANLPPIVAG
ncbi:MAG: transporter substrate-binding domain-containing protein [Acidimicrobiales bacterium]